MIFYVMSESVATGFVRADADCNTVIGVTLPPIAWIIAMEIHNCHTSLVITTGAILIAEAARLNIIAC